MNAGVRAGHYGRTIFDQALAMLATRALAPAGRAAPIRSLRARATRWRLELARRAQPADVTADGDGGTRRSRAATRAARTTR